MAELANREEAICNCSTIDAPWTEAKCSNDEGAKTDAIWWLLEKENAQQKREDTYLFEKCTYITVAQLYCVFTFLVAHELW